MTMARAWQLTSYPADMPGPEHLALVDIALPAPGEGEVHVRNDWLSVDPYMRGRMRPGKSYVPPYEIGEPMEGTAVGTVVASRADGLKPGDKVLHNLGWRDEAVGPAATFEKLPELGVPDQSWLGLMFVTGATAYFGLLHAAGAKAGDVLFVSAAAGGVGSAVVQIARIKGMTVIGSAGGPEKCAFVKELGADAVIDYKVPGTMEEKLRAVAPGGIDVYFDNVGGDHLDAAIECANYGGRFALCGGISGYNTDNPPPLRNPMQIVKSGLMLRGYLLYEYMEQIGHFRTEMAGWINDGSVRSVDTVYDGLERMPEAFFGLFSGMNKGKMVVRV
ncbi:MAG: NADP-dependent oxidoreductase [Sphingobium sp.]